MDSLLGILTSPLWGTPCWLWLTFFLLVIALLVLDLGVLHRDQHIIGMRESLLLYSGYFAVGVAFGGGIWLTLGASKAMDFYTGFLVEQSLSMDNVFVMALVLSFFAIPRQFQHRVLFWGILGVIVLRAAMIGVGTALVHNFEWVLYIFGAFLLFSGIKMLFSGDDEDRPDFNQSRLLLFLRRHVRMTDDMHNGQFLVRIASPKTGQMLLHATPLLMALMFIELADIVFAVDSVPAVLAISQDPFIVYTSNIFAILGLRSLYFALAALMHRFVYLKYALAIVLMFIGGKIFLHSFINLPATLSLVVTLGVLTAGVVLSLFKTRNQ